MTLSSFVRPIIFWTTRQSQDHGDYLLFRFFFFLVVSVVVVAAAVVFVIIVVSRNKKKETRVQILSYYY
jgi:hypothetical protein